MTVHVCPDCQTRRSAVGIHRQDLKVAARKLARFPDEVKYQRAVKQAKSALADSRANLEAHEAGCTFVPEAPRPIRGTLSQRRNNPPKPKPLGPPRPTRAEKRAARVPSRAELLAAIAAEEPVSLTKGRRIR